MVMEKCESHCFALQRRQAFNCFVVREKIGGVLFIFKCFAHFKIRASNALFWHSLTEEMRQGMMQEESWEDSNLR